MNINFLNNYKVENINKINIEDFNCKGYFNKLNINFNDLVNFIDNGGIIVGFRKKNEFYSIYYLEINKDIISLKYEKILNKVSLKDREKFKKRLISFVTDLMILEIIPSFKEINCWDKHIYLIDSLSRKIGFILCGFFSGLLFSILFDDIFIGIFFGILFFLLFNNYIIYKNYKIIKNNINNDVKNK